MIGVESQLAGEKFAALSPAKRALLERRLKEQSATRLSASSIRPRKIGGPCPLSFAQHRLWLVQEMNPASYIYNVPRGLRLRGKLDVTALGRALNEIIRRHEVLRTSFPSEAGEPVQKPEPDFRIPLLVEEVPAGIDPMALAQQEYRVPFHLAVAPAIRARLWRLGEDDYLFLAVMHHIVSDAWTGSIFFDEIGALYSAYSQGKSSPLPELSVQYADYAVWQREYLKGERFAREISYWERHLEGAPALLELPTDRPRTESERSAGALEIVPLPAALRDVLSEFSRREGVTVFMTLLAAFNLLLSRYAGQDDIVVGTDLANRTQVETEKMIGFFINVLPVRVRLSPRISFCELLTIVKEASLGTYAHQEMPLDKIVEAVNPGRNLTYHPVFQVLFVMQNTRPRKASLAGLEANEFRLPMTTARFDLGVFMEEDAGELAGSWLYSTDLFDRATVLRMARHFERILNGAVANPDVLLGDIAMLTREEELEREAEKQKSKKLKSRRLMTTAPEAVALPVN